MRTINLKQIGRKVVKKRTKRLLVLLIGTGFVLWFCIPDVSFNKPTATVLLDNQGYLLSAKIAADEQWRFSSSKQIPEKFKIALTTFEDKRFDSHPGIDVVALARAMYLNLSNGKVVSGGSTLDMQVARMARGKNRSFYQKLVEMGMALKLNIQKSKDEILQLYVQNAPFGGNVVGLDAAAWRYFNQPPDALSWSEAATLAVLPNSPSLIHPGKNSTALFSKKNALLKELLEQNQLDSITYLLACAEPVPQRVLQFPRVATHLLESVKKDGMKGETIYSSLSFEVQNHLREIALKYFAQYQKTHIQNMGIVVVENESGAIVGYLGNVPASNVNANAMQVDMVRAKRSSGSTLKPFLYGGLVSDGVLLPKSWVPDIPSYFSGFAPENFHKKYEGFVPAGQALARSLNVPAVHLLKRYGHGKFLHLMRKTGFTTMNKSADHYGLSIILGGSEVTLLDLAGAYAAMANGTNTPYQLHYGMANRVSFQYQNTLTPFGRKSTIEALKEAYRPVGEQNWKLFRDSKQVAWKTGTSIGHKDAWSIGVNPKYTVGVWVGNADGEGRPEIVGVKVAAPVMFEVFRLLDGGKWFEYKDRPAYRKLKVCNKTGMKAGPFCVDFALHKMPVKSEKSPLCKYHKKVFLDQEKKFRIDGGCYPMHRSVEEIRLVLPPLNAQYYAFKDPSYSPLPKWSPECTTNANNSLQFVYPKTGTSIYIPTGFDQEKKGIIAEVVASYKAQTLFWHLDERFLGETIGVHKMEIQAGRGTHSLTVVSENGERIISTFKVLSD